MKTPHYSVFLRMLQDTSTLTGVQNKNRQSLGPTTLQSARSAPRVRLVDLQWPTLVRHFISSPPNPRRLPPVSTAVLGGPCEGSVQECRENSQMGHLRSLVHYT